MYLVFYHKALATCGVPRTLVLDIIFGKTNHRILKICQETWGFSINCILHNLAFHPNFPCSFTYWRKKIAISPFEFFKYGTLWDTFCICLSIMFGKHVFPLSFLSFFSPFLFSPHLTLFFTSWHQKRLLISLKNRINVFEIKCRELERRIWQEESKVKEVWLTLRRRSKSLTCLTVRTRRWDKLQNVVLGTLSLRRGVWHPESQAVWSSHNVPEELCLGQPLSSCLTG